jgi:hypothetical protein
VTSYDAVCAMDYINPVKFYDRFAMRDNEYFEAGLPFYPWFVNGGQRGESFADVMAQRDAVRVKSCWGGMVAFDARWFRGPPPDDLLHPGPLTFRAEPDVFWDASECCLIHADLEQLVRTKESRDVAVYVNPYVRVGYDEPTFRWLEFSRRFERLNLIPHIVVGWFVKMPWGSPRRTEKPGETVVRREWRYVPPAVGAGAGADAGSQRVWALDDLAELGKWEDVKRVARPGGYCGFPFLLALKNHFEPGERRWEKIYGPPGG